MSSPVIREIKMRRMRLGATQKEVAELAGISRIYYHELESGKNENPSQATIEKITSSLSTLEGHFAQTKNKPLLTLPQVAIQLNVSVHTVREMIGKRAIPYVRISQRRLRIRSEDVDTYVARRTVNSVR